MCRIYSINRCCVQITVRIHRGGQRLVLIIRKVVGLIQSASVILDILCGTGIVWLIVAAMQVEIHQQDVASAMMALPAMVIRAHKRHLRDHKKTDILSVFFYPIIFSINALWLSSSSSCGVNVRCGKSAPIFGCANKAACCFSIMS